MESLRSGQLTLCLEANVASCWIVCLRWQLTGQECSNNFLGSVQEINVKLGTYGKSENSVQLVPINGSKTYRVSQSMHSRPVELQCDMCVQATGKYTIQHRRRVRFLIINKLFTIYLGLTEAILSRKLLFSL